MASDTSMLRLMVVAAASRDVPLTAGVMSENVMLHYGDEIMAANNLVTLSVCMLQALGKSDAR